ncbi:unnamed protein product [Paramecium sonneborni]|uniref:Uncharacterized protein n=1 Tax=Paramecium sonneborni TaxID=65129 RepID=A0A8S1PWL4_9CILI|nr:unnamed protein product [Paramecium sonneborni]
MSERSLSPSDYYQLKHAKSIVINQVSFKKRRSIRYKNNHLFQLELNRCNLSCQCSNCGKSIGFQLKIQGELPLKETCYQKKKRILKKFKAIGNAIIFILIYKLEAIKKWKKKIHILKAARNLTIIRRPAVFILYILKDRNNHFIHQFQFKNSHEIFKGTPNNYSHAIHTQQTSSNPKELRPFDPSPIRSKSRPKIENSGCRHHDNKQFSEHLQAQNNKDSYIEFKRLARSKALQKTVEMLSSNSQNILLNTQNEEIILNESLNQYQQSQQQEPKKNQIQQYLEKMLKTMEQKHLVIKKDNNIKPLSIFNEEVNKSKSKLHFRSNSQLSLTNYQSQFVPYHDQIRTTTNSSSYYNNKKDCLKLIDLMKNKNKVIKIKK